MAVARSGAAAAMFEGDGANWWITGGNDDGYLEQTTEIFNVFDNDFNFGVDLPKPNVDHNLINVNSTHMVLLGGDDSRDHSVYIIDRFVTKKSLHLQN